MRRGRHKGISQRWHSQDSRPLLWVKGVHTGPTRHFSRLITDFFSLIVSHPSPKLRTLCYALPAVFVSWTLLSSHPSLLDIYGICDSSLTLSAFLERIYLRGFYPFSPRQCVAKCWISCEPSWVNHLALSHKDCVVSQGETLACFLKLTELSSAFERDMNLIFSGKYSLAIPMHNHSFLTKSVICFPPHPSITCI